MRIEQPSRRGDSWRVFAVPGEFYDNANEVFLGSVTSRGALQVVKYRFRGEVLRSARRRLEDARGILVSGGHLRSRPLERTISEEARTGSFIVELDSGEARRFHVLAPEGGRRTTAPRYDRPSATEWAEEALQSGRATHADLFRHTSSWDLERDVIFIPQILPVRDEHPRLVIGEYEQLPLASWSMRRPPFLRNERSPEVQRAYAAKERAMDLVTSREISRGSPYTLPGVGTLGPSADVIADAWDVALDAFLEAALPLQVEFARNNARYWRDETRSGVR